MDKKNIFIILIGLFVGSSCTIKSTLEQEVKLEQLNTHKLLKQDARNNIKINRHRQKHIPPEIFDSLSPDFNEDLAAPKESFRFDVAAHDMSADQFFLGLSHEYNENIIVHPDIKTKINLNLKAVTLREVLEAMKKIYKLDYKETKFGYEVGEYKLKTVMFTINKLDISRHGSSGMTLGQEQYNQNYSYDSRYRYASNNGYNSKYGDGAEYSNDYSNMDGYRDSLNYLPGGRVNTRTVDHFWKNLRESILMIIDRNYQPESYFQFRKVPQQEEEKLEQGEKPSVKINKKSGVIIVRAYSNDLIKVAKFIERTENIMSRQVLIEAKFIEVTLNKKFGYGIDWSALFNKANSNNNNFIGFNQQNSGFQANAGDPNNYSTIAKDLLGNPYGNVLKLGYFDNNITAAIDLLSSQGQVNVISSPRISTMNNQKAVIRIGDNSYFITGVQGNYVNTGQFTLGYENNVNFQSFFSGVSLDITPQITSDDMVTLHIHPKISHVGEKELVYTLEGKDSDGSDFNSISRIPTAITKLRESDSIVRARSGEVIIIGGLMQHSDAIKRSGLSPITSAAKQNKKNKMLAALNENTTTKADSISHTELVVLLRPVVIKEGTWSRELNKTAGEMYRNKLKPHHYQPNKKSVAYKSQAMINPFK